MAEFLKPDNLNVVWASGGDRLFPGNTKYASGWGVEIPPRQYFNEIDYKQDQMLAHLNQHGVPVWDATTEYQANKSYVQGSTGTIFQCVLTHAGQDPELDLADTYWRIAFANAGDFYTKTEGDARYAQLANNGSDFVAGTFRTNLSLYSKTETYTQAEVNARTTVASALQSQQQTSNTVLLTPLRLSDSLKGTNQSLTSNGFQKLPGGLIIQWGNIPSGSTSGTETLPIPFPSTFLSVVITDSAVGGVHACAAAPAGLTAFSWRLSDSAQTACWMALGY
jgi:hypothetical protein